MQRLPGENFCLAFNEVFIKSTVDRMDDNADIFRCNLDDPAFETAVMEHELQPVLKGPQAPAQLTPNVSG